MKKAVASVLACASLFLAIGHGASTIPPLDESMSAITAVVSGSPRAGHAYSIDGGVNSWARVLQSQDNGVLVQIRTPSYMYSYSPTLFFLSTGRKLADGQILPGGLCGIYEGLHKYTTVLGAVSTVHKFKEVSCQPYMKAVEKRSRKEAPKQMPYGQWTDGDPNLPLDGLLASSRVMRLRPDDKAIDLNRWQEAHRKELPGQDAFFAFYVDKQTIEKNITSYSATSPALPPVNYTFWMNGNLKITQGEEKEQYLFEPNRHTVSCDKRTMDNKTIQPESPEEKIYQFFCLSPDAQNTVLELQHRERTEQDKAKLKTTLFQGLGALWGASSLIRGF